MRLALPLWLLFAQATLAVEHATFSVDAAGVATKTQGTAGFSLGTGSVAGEYAIQIGASAADDAAGGVLFSSIAERGRIDAGRIGGTQLQFAVGGTVADADLNSINTRALSGALAVTTTRIGAAGVPGEPATAAPNGGEPFGADFGAAYFPFSEGWTAGTFSSSTVNANGTFGALDTYNGAAGVTLEENAFGPGRHRVNVAGVSDPFRQGMLYVNSASNVGRYATVQPSPDGNGYLVNTPDNDGYFEFDPSSDPDLVNEDDGVTTPFSFLFVPAGQTGLTAGLLNPSYTSSLGVVEDFPYFSTGSDFQLTTVDPANAPGQFRLTIQGGSPTQGTLLLNNAVLGIAGDNSLTYQSDGDGWLITSEDIESNLLTGDTVTLDELDGIGQTHDLAIPYFSFLYVPNEGAATAAAPIPAADTFSRFDRAGVIAWNTEVQAANNNNTPGDVYLNVTGQTPGADIRGMGNQKGDNSYAAYGQPLSENDGIMFATISEGLRDNSAVNGFQEYGEVGTNLFSGYWAVITATADGSPQGEHNVNHAVAFFGADSGFQMAAGVDIPNVAGVDYDQESVIVSPIGANALTDGVLIATPYGNDDNYLVAEPQEDGSGWRVLEFDNGVSVESNSTEPDNFSYVYLPYESENLIAGLVAEDGTLISSSAGVGVDWSLSKETDGFGFAQYRLSINGKTPDDGMLLLTSTGRFASAENFDNSIIYETDGSDFLIRGLDHITNADTGFVDFQEAGFMFAYIDYENGPIAPEVLLAPGDFNGDGLVNAADYTVWRDNAGTTAGANALSGDADGDGDVDTDDYTVWVNNYGTAAPANAGVPVPEPAAVLLVGLTIASLTVTRRS
ncbi:hypothetical protein Pla108_22290 [Botrimarina colliarenosi]|uniref:PEP-CTERM protein-sorting domain-containing protein n=1 Tax=Botrimarina colliarenosi TaxID=2528001 RepID=A0A5C6AIL0_9BACT|nr:hypothetical protein [Botrimarina colliarenosi]TWT98073.1 hypothetical protein Pla108_22290 [Botrimarina colliarenosi]